MMGDQLLIVYEIVFVCLACLHVSSRPKLCLWKTAGVLVWFTLVITIPAYWLLSQMPFYGNGNGLFFLFGFCFLLPLKLLYHDSGLRLLIELCSGMVYTLAVYSVSVQVARLFWNVPFLLMVLICQTLLFLATFHAYLRYFRNVYIYILQNQKEQTRRFLIQTNLLWFILVFTAHLTFVFPELSFLRLFALLVMFVSALLSYNLVFNIIKNTTAVEKLEQISRYDNLTGLKNRRCFFEEADSRIRKRQAFTLVFIDLDNFKSINDNYGHQAGDDYLRAFAGRTQELIGHDGELYRLAGDEFVCIYEGLRPRSVISKMAAAGSRAEVQEAGEIRFLGASTGTAQFPMDATDLNELITIADGEMYESKKKKVARGIIRARESIQEASQGEEG